MLGTVLTRLAADTGYHKTDKRAALVRLLNDAAKEMHKKIDCNKIYREVTLVVPANRVVSLPSFIGELKGMRIHTEDLPMPLFGFSYPRYVKDTEEYRFRNWRDLGDSPVHTLTVNVAPLTLSASIAENITVLISGQTNASAQIQEEVIMNATSKTTVASFGPQIFSIVCLSTRTVDITIKDTDNVELAVLYNNRDKTLYKIVDVSELFMPLDTAASESLIDVCYKLPATELNKDSDSFYAGDDYDEAWYNMAMAIFLRPITARLEESLAFEAKSLKMMKASKSHGEREIIKKVSFGPNKYYNLFRWRWSDRPYSCTDVDNNV